MASERKTSGLELETVVQGFSEAEKTLAALGDELTLLSKLRQEQTASRDALSEVAKKISEFAKNAGERVTELAEAQSQTEAVLKAGAEILSGSELAEVTSNVASLTQSIDAMREELSSTRNSIETSTQQLTGRITDSHKQLSLRIYELAETIARVESRVSRSIFGRIF